MADGFTGIDRERAKNDIDNFFDETEWIHRHLRDGCQDLFQCLKDNWAGPNAVTDTQILSSRYKDFLTRFANRGQGICEGATEAANKLLEACGEEPIYTRIYSEFYAFVDDFPNCEVKLPDGRTGMAKETVGQMLDFFVKQANLQVGRMFNLPRQIAFYDPEGNLVETYDNNIGEFVEEARQLIDDTNTTLKTDIEGEQEDLTIAQKEAQDILENMGNS